MRIKSFEDIISWKKGKDLYLLISKEFGSIKDYGFKDQIFRATLSITNNIAEGFDRYSDKELVRYLVIARGSCAEVRSMLHIAYEDNKLPFITYVDLVDRTKEISKLLTGFIKVLETGDKKLVT